MAVEWSRASDFVIEIAQELIDLYHPTLQDARIAFLFREEAPMSNGKATLGKAAKVNAQWKPLLQEEFDFVIWFAHDRWELLDRRQRRALVDHELCHCRLVDGEPTIVAHDIEEFNVIIQRHGEWLPDMQDTGRAFRQEPLLNVPSGRQGKLVAIDIPFGTDKQVDRETGEIFTDQVLAETARQMNDLFDDVEVTVTRV